MLTDLQEIKGMLDKSIVYWREERKAASVADSFSKEADKTNIRREYAALCYIDAYQSIRKNIFDELLP